MRLNPSKLCKSIQVKRSKPIEAKKGLKRTYKPTGEKALMDRLWIERGGRCAITGKFLGYETDVWCCLHVLGKKAYPKFRLNPDNILICDKLIHHYYDNSDRETLLKHFPGAIIIYEMKDELRRRYYNS